ncbi:MAG TPA: MlaD family protein [Solirubrobacteraceae bacterium]|nr:MlaD family protein [Solirubrobacteraceae bacterium]
MSRWAVSASRSKAAAAIAAALCALVALVAILFATAAGGGGGGYTVWAEFDDAGNLVTSENVKIDGVKVGTVGTVSPTPGGRAAVTLNIANPGFQDFREDATCTIEPQALIGEKYVNCLPTQQRAEGAPLPPPLGKIPSGQEGAGDYKLPVARTSSPVGVDLLSDIGHLPENQRLAIILNELGAGLAGRGSDLNAVLHRSNPALRELEKLIGMLADENKVLGNLAEEGDRALAPIAHERKQLQEFFAQGNTVAEATARHSRELGVNFHELPNFLRELRPYLKRLEAFAEQSIPTFTELGLAAPGINRTFANIGPFSTSTTQYFKSLGASSKKLGTAVVGTQPLLKRVEALGSAAGPFAKSFSELFASLRSTGGIERLLDFIFMGAGDVNGYDSLGHFARAVAIGNKCAAYKMELEKSEAECRANFYPGSSPSSAQAASAGAKSSDTTVAMARIEAMVKGATLSQAMAEYPGDEGGVGASGGPAGTSALAAGLPSAVAQPVGGASSGTTYYTPPSEGSQAGGMLLNYLLGN